MSTAFLQFLHKNFWIERSWQWSFWIMKIFKSIFGYIFQKRPVAVPIHFCTQSVYYHIHTSYLFYRLQIPLWWILLFVLCYISTVMPLEIPMTLVSESFSCYLFQQEKHGGFAVEVENNSNTDTGKLLLYTEDLYKTRWRGRRNNWTLRLQGSDKWLKFIFLIST